MRIGIDSVLAARGFELFEWCDLGQLNDDDPPYGCSAFAHVEHAIHELAHADLLDLPLGPDLSDRVGKTLGALMRCDQVEQEARTWAIEWRVVEHLGLPMEYGEVFDHAEIQGCDREQVEFWLAQGDTYVRAMRVVEIMRGTGTT